LRSTWQTRITETSPPSDIIRQSRACSVAPGTPSTATSVHTNSGKPRPADMQDVIV
jgi:hypothetical protein